MVGSLRDDAAGYGGQEMTYESLISSGKMVETVLAVLRGEETSVEAIHFVLMEMNQTTVLSIATANGAKVGTPHI